VFCGNPAVLPVTGLPRWKLQQRADMIAALSPVISCMAECYKAIRGAGIKFNR
jgi:hypothetical protein